MEATEWDSIMQLVSDGLTQDVPIPLSAETTVTEKPAPRRPTFARAVSTTQIPTPPQSNSGTPTDEPDHSTIVSVSTTFFPGANLEALPTDLVMLSSDSVFFYVHTNKVLGASQNGFNSLLPFPNRHDHEEPGPILSLPDDSAVLNILLHTIYNLSASHYSPPPEAILAAVEALQRYGLALETYISPSTPLFNLVLANASAAPIQFYAAAASLDLHDLAVPVSSHLLSYSLADITDGLARKIGPLYLKRLFFLHLGRMEALKRLLLPPPQPHVPNPDCDFSEQKKLTRAWALASAYLAWDVRSDLGTAAIEAALRPLGDYLACDQCKLLLRERIDHLVSQWSVVKRTI